MEFQHKRHQAHIRNFLPVVQVPWHPATLHIDKVALSKSLEDPANMQKDHLAHCEYIIEDTYG